jgi:glyoxalase family protein
MGHIRGTHHLTMSVGGAQEDFDFHTGLLGLFSVKKTVLFDGKLPIYHLYYGNRRGDVSTLLTTFPFRQAGVMGRRGSNQIKMLNLSVPDASLDFWAGRLADAGVAYEEAEIFSTRRLHFAHPCGIEYALVGETTPDDREPYGGNGVDAENAIRGAHGITISVREGEEMTEFLTTGLGGTHVGSQGPRDLYEVGGAGHGRFIELLHEPDVAPGTWRFGEGTVHHVAYDVGDPDSQQELKDWLEGLGYTDCSDRKDRQYFYSVYVRSPSGALVELAYSKPESFEIDETFENLGSEFQLPPQFEDRRAELLGALEPLDTGR